MRRALFAALLAAAPLGARELEGVLLPDERKADGVILLLNGAALRTATVFRVKVWAGAFYAPARVRDEAEALASPGPLRFDFHFLRDVGRERGAEAWRWQFKESNRHAYPNLARDVEALAEAFGPIKKGTVQSVELAAGEARVYEDGALKARIPGRDFQKAFLSVFLGPRPPTEAVKRGFLGG